ncbi:MAG: hypothetical protein M9895_00095 [Aquamicrobium sp.]|uniref:hypothetical protein n=1 Tax=Aquamicrobium sp. TaxID=1872579 RepID=UPI00349E6EA4|nr:hypothetical protein [Aquamicrobium sp.]
MAKLISIISVLAVSTVAFSSPALSAPSLEETFKAVCASPAVKSEKLIKACASETAPEGIKDGSRFKHQGIGAELNVLAANLHLLKR